DSLCDRLRPAGEAWPFEDAHRAVPEDRACSGDRAHEPLARLGPDVEAEPVLRQAVERVDARLRILLERGGADDVARQLHLEAERILDSQLLGHLSANEDGVGATAEVSQ